MVIFHETNYICPFYLAQRKGIDAKANKAREIVEMFTSFTLLCIINDFIVSNLKGEKLDF